MSQRAGSFSKFRPATTRTIALFLFTFLALPPSRSLFAGAAKSGAGRGGKQDAGPSASQNTFERTASNEVSVGIPWTGAPGITETVRDIMERDRRTPAVPAEEFVEGEPIRTIRGILLQENPSAPAVAQWPPLEPSTSVTEPFAPQTLGVSFLGADKTESPFRPPDTMGNVGPTQVMVFVNGRIKVFDKTGVLGALNTSTDVFFSSVRAGSSVSDPHVRYDRLSGRWFLSIINVSTPNRVCLAVSNGSTITDATSFTFFQFQHDLVGTTPNPDTGNFADYDTLGVDSNALYLGVNIFDPFDNFLGTSAYVVRKSDLLAGTLTVTAFRALGTCGTFTCTAGPYTPQGVDNDDPAATEGYFIGHDLDQFSRLTIRRITNPGGTPAISANIFLTVPTTTFPIDQPASGSVNPLDALDFRLFAAAIHKNKTTGVSSL